MAVVKDKNSVAPCTGGGSNADRYRLDPADVTARACCRCHFGPAAAVLPAVPRRSNRQAVGIRVPLGFAGRSVQWFEQG